MPARIELRCYGELNDLLPPARRQRSFSVELELEAAVIDVVQAAGVPHTEVALVLVDGQPAGWDHRVGDGARVAAYPTFRTLRAEAEGAGTPRFVLDVHLGKLARHLRLLGFDVAYRNDLDDDELASIAERQGRVLLSRDTGLLMRRQVETGYLVRADDPDEQVVEVVLRFGLCDHLDPFGRCLHCNGLLEEVDKQDVLDRLEPKTRRYYDDFRRCRGCDRVYWQGSHTERLAAVVEAVREACARAGRGAPQPPER